MLLDSRYKQQPERQQQLYRIKFNMFGWMNGRMGAIVMTAVTRVTITAAHWLRLLSSLVSLTTALQRLLLTE